MVSMMIMMLLSVALCVCVCVASQDDLRRVVARDVEEVLVVIDGTEDWMSIPKKCSLSGDAHECWWWEWRWPLPALSARLASAV